MQWHRPHSWNKMKPFNASSISPIQEALVGSVSFQDPGLALERLDILRNFTSLGININGLSSEQWDHLSCVQKPTQKHQKHTIAILFRFCFWLCAVIFAMVLLLTRCICSLPFGFCLVCFGCMRFDAFQIHSFWFWSNAFQIPCCFKSASILISINWNPFVLALTRIASNSHCFDFVFHKFQT